MAYVEEVISRGCVLGLVSKVIKPGGEASFRRFSRGSPIPGKSQFVKAHHSAHPSLYLEPRKFKRCDIIHRDSPTTSGPSSPAFFFEVCDFSGSSGDARGIINHSGEPTSRYHQSHRTEGFIHSALDV